MDRKKELKEQYLQTKPDMGILIIRSKGSNKYYLEKSLNLKGTIGRSKFQLGYGSHPNKELQNEWNELGEDNFTFEILDILEYSKDETKTDYKEDLETLLAIWEEKLSK